MGKKSKKKDKKQLTAKKDAKKRVSASKAFCPHCKKHCPLTSPRCKKGVKEAEKLGILMSG